MSGSCTNGRLSDTILTDYEKVIKTDIEKDSINEEFQLYVPCEPTKFQRKVKINFHVLPMAIQELALKNVSN